MKAEPSSLAGSEKVLCNESEAQAVTSIWTKWPGLNSKGLVADMLVVRERWENFRGLYQADEVELWKKKLCGNMGMMTVLDKEI